MGKFFIGMLAGVAATIAAYEVLKTEKVKDSIETARSRIYDAIGELVDQVN